MKIIHHPLSDYINLLANLINKSRGGGGGGGGVGEKNG